ncbi:conserved hypothetical protein [Theileria orientalis strain Shintoku]|uniref:Uncharacterized protein n=1 Tax=Theileria orientalis strain Shintoku TaxID=869250 RepID=J4DA14_THEOR|nr:conserved hypothetical protein [Theileria orientalis strain Shintoku]PVC53598.1 hypothetical protein MACL_00003636 [Theileria orientalis]BAM41720.1 conserved hypothetical protein [Theileria orientalis strain Shintoku]|eukprot:XP_009692021.1 conserved hypothetical protein [Theileria orientalis strain Shintoku]
MDSDVSIDNLVSLVEYVSLCDSYINTDPPAQLSSANRNIAAETPLYERLDTHTAHSSVVSEDSPVFLPEQVETGRVLQDDSVCTNLVCSSTISSLERKVKLLETQNSQLIVNTCSLYNTLTKHIESLREELRRKDEVINNM